MSGFAPDYAIVPRTELVRLMDLLRNTWGPAQGGLMRLPFFVDGRKARLGPSIYAPDGIQMEPAMGVLCVKYEPAREGEQASFQLPAMVVWDDEAPSATTAAAADRARFPRRFR